MKRNTTISMVVAIAALAFAAQSFAFGGGAGGSMGGNHQISSSVQHGPSQQGLLNGTGTQHFTVKGKGTQQGPSQQGLLNGTGTQHVTVNGKGSQRGAVNGAGTTTR